MNEIEVDQFVQTTVDHYTGGNVLVELTVDDCEQGPRFWLNSTTETDALSQFNGEELEYPLVYNAGFSVQTRDVKSAVVTTLMAVLLGIVISLVSAEHKKERHREPSAVIQKLQELYQKYRLFLGAMLVAGMIAIVFFYVYDTQIKIVINKTEREHII